MIFFHALPDYFKSGFIGVDIFFIISGFLISEIIFRMLRNNEFSYLEFYKRRILRIFPALITVLLTSLIFGFFLLFPSEYESLGKHVLGGGSFISNIFYWLEMGYFDILSSLKPLLHLWSLGVEEQFYIFWPILLVFFFKKNRKTILMMSVLFIVSLTFNLYLGTKNPPAGFYLPFTRFWEFLSGAILAHINFYNGGILNIISKNFKKNNLTLNTISFIGLGLFILAFFIINTENFQKGYNILLVFGIFLIIAGGKESIINKNILSNKALVYIGVISYPLYLWHWPLLSFARIINAKEQSLTVTILLVIFSFVLSWATYLFIEKPLRFSNNKKIPFVLCLIMLFICVSGYIIYKNNGFKFRFPNQEKVLSFKNNDANSRAVKKLANNDNFCKKLYDINTEHYNCFISGKGSSSVFIIGDSRAQAIYSAYEDSLVKKGYRVVLLGLPGCPYILPETFNKKVNQASCNESYQKVISIINNENPKSIIISNNGLRFGNEYLEEGMNKTINSLPKNIQIFWVTDTPNLPFNLNRCLSRIPFSGEPLKDCSFPAEDWTSLLLDYKNLVEKISKENKQIKIIDPTSALCSDNKCFVLLNGNFVYRDYGFHLSWLGGRLLLNKHPIAQFFPDLKK